jgi:hypothetical protein
MPTHSQPSELPQPLIERVRARVADAVVALDRRTRASRPRSKRPRKPRVAPLTSAPPHTPGLTPEVRSLRHVFHELGETHREYRRRTGQQVQPELRDAARAFKQAPTLTSLVVVAAFLDEEGILAW